MFNESCTVSSKNEEQRCDESKGLKCMAFGQCLCDSIGKYW